MDISVEREERTDQTGPDQMPEQDKAQLLTNSAMLYLRFTLAVEVAILPELVELVAVQKQGTLRWLILAVEAVEAEIIRIHQA